MPVPGLCATTSFSGAWNVGWHAGIDRDAFSRIGPEPGDSAARISNVTRPANAFVRPYRARNAHHCADCRDHLAVVPATRPASAAPGMPQAAVFRIRVTSTRLSITEEK